MDVGILGLDTSHAETFASHLTALDRASVTAVWDDESVRDEAYVAEFCDAHGATRYDDPLALGDDVDAAMVLTVDWDRHADLAVPLLEMGVPTFVDKPVAGRTADVERLADAAAAGGAPLFGGSAVAFHPGLSDLPRGEADRTLFCAGYGDPFYYGVHVLDAARRLAGRDWTSVAPGRGPGDVVDVSFADDVWATVRLDGPRGGDATPAFAVLDVGSETRARRLETWPDPDANETMHENFLSRFLAVARGDADETARILDGATLLLASRSALERGEAVTPGSDALREVHADGAAFAAEYAPPG